jgi:hypothetical protein
MRRSAGIMLAAMACVACDGAGLPSDEESPSIAFEVVRLTDSTARVFGTITDDAGVMFAKLVVEHYPTSYSLHDTLSIDAGAREVAFDVPLPTRTLGHHRVSIVAMDRSSHLAVLLKNWFAGSLKPVIAFETGLPDTLRQPGNELVFTVTAPGDLKSVRVEIDKGTPASFAVAPDTIWFRGRPRPYESPKPVTLVIPAVMTNGRHTFTLTVTDDSSNTTEKIWTQVVQVPEVSFSAQPIAGGAGKDIRMTDLNARGDVSGYIDGSPTERRGIVWRNGVITELGDSARSIAKGLNDAGDVVGQDGTAAVIWRNGTKTILRAGVVVDVTNAGTALVQSGTIGYTVDATTAQQISTFAAGFYFGVDGMEPAMNDAAQVATIGSYHMYGNQIATIGFTTRIPALRPGAGDRFGRGAWRAPIAVSPDARLLGVQEGEYFVSSATTSQYLTARLPGRVGAIDANGEVTSLKGDSLFLWSAERGTRRIVLSGAAGWRAQAGAFGMRVIARNASGQIAVNAVHATTAQKGILLLTPQ